MWVPLAVLAALSLAGGYIGVPRFLEPVFPLAEEGHDLALVAYSVIAGLAGIALAFWMYVARPGLADSVARILWGIPYKAIYNKYFVDEIYGAVVVNPVVDGSRSVLWRGADVGLIDGAANGIGTAARGVGGVLRKLQSGNIRSYAVWVLAGSLIAIFFLGLAGGVR
jgi:NADH-quinone oxidoreductase subunit L